MLISCGRCSDGSNRKARCTPDVSFKPKWDNVVADVGHVQFASVDPILNVGANLCCSNVSEQINVCLATIFVFLPAASTNQRIPLFNQSAPSTF